MKRAIRNGVATLALAAATTVAHAGQATFDRAGRTLYVTWTDGARTIDYVHTPDGPWTAVEVVAKPGAQPIIGISHSTAGVVVHSGAGGSANLKAEAWAGVGAEANGSYGLRDPRDGQVRSPFAARTIALDPTAPAGSTVLLDAGHVALANGALRALALVQRASGEAVLVDHDFAGGPVRRTPLGFTPPIGSNKGSFVATPDGHVWATFASEDKLRLFDLGDLSAPGALQPAAKATVSSFAGVDVSADHIEGYALLSGVTVQPTVAISYQAGDELIRSVFDGTTLRQVARQSVPAGARGFMEDDGIWFYLLPYIEQENLYKAYESFSADGKITMGER
jgi:hypothetical protein